MVSYSTNSSCVITEIYFIMKINFCFKNNFKLTDDTILYTYLCNPIDFLENYSLDSTSLNLKHYQLHSKNIYCRAPENSTKAGRFVTGIRDK